MILQTSLPYDPNSDTPLPGIAPLDPAEWLIVDDAYAAQMGERARLLRDKRDAVLWQDTSAHGAAQELLDTVLAALPDGFRQEGDTVTCPDGRSVALDRSNPLVTLNALCQEDFCILRKEGAEHVLCAALLCFPASWTLAEKAGRPLIAIHETVDSYDAGIARRVQRLFDGVGAGRPLWRFNLLWYEDPTLHQPRSVDAPRKHTDPQAAGFLRSERQSILRLQKTGAVVFSIHTFVLARASVTGSRSAGSAQ